MKPTRLHRRWQRRKARLLQELQKLARRCRTQEDAEVVHGLRVALRRLRLVVRLGRPLFGASVLEAFGRWSKIVAGNTSPVRDLDVTIEWLATRAGAQDVVARLRERRGRCWRAACARIQPLAGEVLGGLRRAGSGKKSAQKLARRLERLEAAYGQAVRQRLDRFSELDAEARHDFRRTLRWWRYLREVILPRRKQTTDPLLQHLIAAQEAIGEHQNRTMARAALARVRNLPAVAALEAQLEAEQAALGEAVRDSLQALAKSEGWPSVR